MAAFENWGEAILFSVGVVIVFGLIIVQMNALYGQTYTTGLDSKANSTKARFIEYTSDSRNKIDTGGVDYGTDAGFTLKSSYGILKDFLSLSWDFVSGGWIEEIVGYLNLGESGAVLAFILRILFIISLVFALIRLIFGVNP